jgi:anti-sigma regulatory factor (Ser/Thr protein kinase)
MIRASTNLGQSLRLVVPGTPDGLAEAMRVAQAFCDDVDAPGLSRANVMTALDEVLANIVHHGLRDVAGTIELTMGRDEQAVVAHVADTAGPFDPLLVPPPNTALPMEKRKVGGLGIALVRALTDEVAYDRRDGRNHLTLTWRLGAAPSKDGNAD